MFVITAGVFPRASSIAGVPEASPRGELPDAQQDARAAPALPRAAQQAEPASLQAVPPAVLRAVLPAELQAALPVLLPAWLPDVLPDVLQAALQDVPRDVLRAALQDGLPDVLPDALRAAPLACLPADPDGWLPDVPRAELQERVPVPCAHTQEPEPAWNVRR